MRKLKFCCFVFVALLVVASCSSGEKQLPGCNAPCAIDSTRQKLLILGNSITQHGPLPSEGWLGNWGMAASSREKDFVRVTMSKLRAFCSCVSQDYKAINISFWERNFDFDFSTEVSTRDLHSYQPDILVLRLGENVPEDYARNRDYEAALEALIKRFAGEGTHVLITGNFWPSDFKDEAQRRVAEKLGYEFVSLSDLAGDEKNKALDHYQGGVGQHPSDQGMEKIAQRISERIILKKWYLE